MSVQVGGSSLARLGLWLSAPLAAMRDAQLRAVALMP
jgi:hypothetical protein